MKVGSLFSGAAGLDRAVEAVFGATPAWFSEIDPAASKVLAYRFPGVPNLGSVAEIDWAAVEPVDIICGGFPCTDVSAAGKRAGMHGTRSGLWSHMAEAIDVLRPRYVVIENVRGLLNANANRPMEPEADDLGDGSDRPVLRAIGAVLGDLADIGGYEARWVTMAAADVGAPHRRERVFILAELADTPRDGRHERRTQPAGQQRRPDATLGGAADVELLPTPNAQDGNGGGRYNSAGHQSTLPGEVRLLTTPRKSDGDGGANPLSRHERMDDVETRVIRLLCTPSTADGNGGHAPRVASRGSTLLLPGQAREMATAWGKYEPAIRRWEAITRPAPAPTEPNRNGNPRLSAAFSEWLMGWPAGWVTDPAIGISRNDQLRIVGNGVVSQCAAAALRYLLTVAEGGTPRGTEAPREAWQTVGKRDCNE